jgi:pyruvate dehydrogenase E2 component (dihydrolipoamide acetyltransferase)
MATEVVLPMLGITVEKGKILQWFKFEGDRVEKGESIFEVEADKVTTEVESPASGILKKILIHPDVEVPLLTVVGIITGDGEDVPEKYRATAPKAVQPSQGMGPETMAVPASAGFSETAVSGPTDRIRAVPVARKIARERGIDLSLISGSGPGGTILKRDVEGAIASPGAGMAVARDEARRATPLARKLAEREGIPLDRVAGTGPRGRITKMDVVRTTQGERPPIPTEASAEPVLGTTIPMSSIRKVIARRMSQSAFTAPHISFFSDVEMDGLISLREQILPDFEAQFGVRVSINDFIVKAVGLTIGEYPLLNASVDGENIKINPDINVGLAVAMEEGLIVPAILRVDRCGLGEIARMRADLVARARGGKLTMEEIERGTFTVSSLAQFDISFFTAILNPPQSGILTVGKLDEKLSLVDGGVKAKRVTRFGLAVDHRIIDGAIAAQFLQSLKTKLENPSYAFLQL